VLFVQKKGEKQQYIRSRGKVKERFNSIFTVRRHITCFWPLKPRGINKIPDFTDPNLSALLIVWSRWFFVYRLMDNPNGE